MKLLLAALVEAGLLASADTNDEAAAAAFRAAFSTIRSRADSAQAEVAALKIKIDDANTKLASALRARAEAAVEVAVKAGRIKDEADLRAKWAEAYVRDEEGTKTLLASLPEAKAPRGVPPVATAGDTQKAQPQAKCLSAAEAWSRDGAIKFTK